VAGFDPTADTLPLLLKKEVLMLITDSRRHRRLASDDRLPEERLQTSYYFG